MTDKKILEIAQIRTKSKVKNLFGIDLDRLGDCFKIVSELCVLLDEQISQVDGTEISWDLNMLTGSKWLRFDYSKMSIEYTSMDEHLSPKKRKVIEDICITYRLVLLYRVYNDEED
jgi:hypothetical protein